jgi:hypothetical protein
MVQNIGMTTTTSAFQIPVARADLYVATMSQIPAAKLKIPAVRANQRQRGQDFSSACNLATIRFSCSVSFIRNEISRHRLVPNWLLARARLFDVVVTHFSFTRFLAGKAAFFPVGKSSGEGLGAIGCEEPGRDRPGRECSD